VVYASDHELHAPALAGGTGRIIGQDRRHAEFLANADLVIHDAQYVASEYRTKIGWGHSTVEYAMAVARHAGAKRLALTHHDPTRSDAALDAIMHAVRGRAGADELDVFAAAEGLSIELGDDAQKPATGGGRRRAKPPPARLTMVRTTDGKLRTAPPELRP
jgi:hypothetical protein